MGIAWLVFPLVLAVLALGCGLLLERIAGVRLPGVLLLPAGLAVIVVVGLFPIMSDATAELTMPLIALLAVIGLLLSPPWRRGTPDWAAVACAVAVYCVYAAPIVLSGEATIAAYTSERDNATYLALVDRFMEHGRSLDGLPEGEYRGLLELLLPEGYPLGSLVPLGVGQKLVGEDVAWLLQPYMAFVAAMLALCLYSLTARIVASRAVRAGVAFVASQPALLFALAFWAGVKELSAAWGLALLGALLTLAVREDVRGRALLPLAAAAAAMLGMLSFAGAIWLIPPLGAALVIVLRQGRTTGLARAGSFLALFVLVAIPALLLTSEFWKEATAPDVTGEGLGALVNSLSPRQVFGIWPAGDFQSTPGAEGLTNVLIGLVLVSAVAGLVLVAARREWELALYVGGTVVAGLAIAVLGSPWIDAKAFATLSPALVLIALVGALLVPTGTRRVAGTAVAGAIAAGVIWSNVLAYHDVELSPRNRFDELQEIADGIDGEGPTLLTELEPYASRHFLRDAGLVNGPSDVFGAVIPGPDGQVRTYVLTRSADVEEYSVAALLHYRTIVRRASAVSSRPPSAYRLTWRGRYYEVWQRRHQPERVLSHQALGERAQPATVPKCSAVLAVARSAGRGGRVAAVERPPVTIVKLPAGMPVWKPDSVKSEDPLPDDLRSGAVKGTVAVPEAGTYSLWITGSFARRIELLVDGERVAEPRHEFNGFPHVFYLRLGSKRLDRGSHQVEVRYEGGGALNPGTGGHAAFAPGLQPRLFSIGPLALQRDDVNAPVDIVPASRARSLCGKRLDWLEPLGPEGVIPTDPGQLPPGTAAP